MPELQQVFCPVAPDAPQVYHPQHFWLFRQVEISNHVFPHQPPHDCRPNPAESRPLSSMANTSSSMDA
ncbi:MAG: hypothetical protein DPW19_00240 [cyanobacterium CYA1]|nr:hypothetical protein [cyanobacterium CYA1]